MPFHRAQILLDHDQHAKLERLARDSKRSISRVVRDIVDDHLTRCAEAEAVRRSLAALDGLSDLRQRLEHTHGRIDPALLETIRQERDGEMIS